MYGPDRIIASSQHFGSISRKAGLTPSSAKFRWANKRNRHGNCAMIAGRQLTAGLLLQGGPPPLACPTASPRGVLQFDTLPTMSSQEERSVARKATADAVTGGSDLSALLLDAKLAELCTSIRALARSNDELREALKEQPGDRDFIVAVHENEEIIVKRREAAAELVKRLRKAGVDADLPEDILNMKMEWKGSIGSDEVEDDQEGDGAEEAKVSLKEVPPTSTASANASEGLYL